MVLLLNFSLLVFFAGCSSFFPHISLLFLFYSTVRLFLRSVWSVCVLCAHFLSFILHICHYRFYTTAIAFSATQKFIFISTLFVCFFESKLFFVALFSISVSHSIRYLLRRRHQTSSRYCLAVHTYSSLWAECMSCWIYNIIYSIYSDILLFSLLLIPYSECT